MRGRPKKIARFTYYYAVQGAVFRHGYIEYHTNRINQLMVADNLGAQDHSTTVEMLAFASLNHMNTNLSSFAKVSFPTPGYPSIKMKGRDIVLRS
jgi:hypothetical protein